MQDRSVRYLQPGLPPKNLQLPTFDSTAGDIFALGSGGGAIAEGHSLTINGAQATPGSPVKSGDTVALQPNADHG